MEKEQKVTFGKYDVVAIVATLETFKERGVRRDNPVYARLQNLLQRMRAEMDKNEKQC